MDISIIIPTKNRQKDLVECLKSIAKQSVKPNEVIIVDASDNQSLRHLLNRLRLIFPMRLVYLYDRSSIPRGRNIGVQEASGEIVMFLDDDVVLEENYFEEIIKAFKDPTVGGVMGTIRVRPPTSFLARALSRIEQVFNFLFFLTMSAGEGKIRPSGMPTFCSLNESVKEATDVEVLLGYEMAYRRDVFDYYQFDENLSGYSWNEDVDFSYRVSKHFRLVFTPFAKLMHKHGGGKKVDQRPRKRMMICNHAYLFGKNMPQGFRNRSAFYISIVGIIGKTILFRHSFGGLLGTIEGLVDVFIRGNPSFP